MTGFMLGARSRANLKGVHPDLVRVVERAIQITPQDFMVIEGLRSEERQRQLYAQGRTVPGKIVTWTMASKHRKQASGYGEAVDCAPIVAGAIPWNDFRPFHAVAEAMFAAAAELGVRLRWGADWDQDGKPRERGETDSPHFELAR